MNFIYDIYLNLDKEYINEFFEWNREDKVIHVKRIPVFKVDNESYNNILNNKFILSDSTYKEIENETVTYNGTYLSAAIFTNGLEVITVSFDNKESDMKSRLLIDEAYEVLTGVKEIMATSIDYENTEKNIYDKTPRYIRDIKEYILTEIEYCYKNNNSKLIYLFYELFGKKNNDIDVIYTKLKRQFTTAFDTSYIDTYNFLKKLNV